MKKLWYLLSLLTILGSCIREQKDTFYQGFIEPPVEARPFVRWWWNGNHIDSAEIIRELDILKETGIGGVEINPIAMPKNAIDIGTTPLEWLSKEWNELLALACKAAKERGMVTDMIVGSGWPFGGEFLQPDEYLERVVVNRIKYNGPSTIDETFESLLRMTDEKYNIYRAESNEILFISLVPEIAVDESGVIDLIGHYQNESLHYRIDRGGYFLVYGILQKGHRKVRHGALGASGNVMDHYRNDVTNKYLQRLLKISSDSGIPLNQLLRSLFCDSIELAGSNWTDDFQEIFTDNYGYDLKNYLPFIFYQDQELIDFKPVLRERLKRIRYDYNRLLVKVFLDNFTKTFKDFCTRNGLQCKYQAYGLPFHMGLLEGYMIPDIPEGNNWIYSADMDLPFWTWNKDHGYMIRNLYAAAGGHLKGRKIISNEAMTNTRGVFKTSLEEIKQHDDMNFISGMTHSVLHGFNYSPPEAGFPGWVRYGSYFSPQNTWWPYFHKWVDYNARLSYVFQNSKPVKSIALLGPTGDIWSSVGLGHTYFHLNPWYFHELWQTLSQNGSSCEYLNQQVVQDAEMEDGMLVYGQMQYKSLWLNSVKSIHPETALNIQKFVENGGKLVMIDSIPSRALSLQRASENDFLVESVFRNLVGEYPKQVFLVKSPEEKNLLMEWTSDVLDLTGISRQVKISNPDPALYQIHQEKDGKSIYFFTNTRRKETLNFSAEFPIDKKMVWIWNPETGERSMHAYLNKSNNLSITLAPLESKLLVFEPTNSETPQKINNTNDDINYDDFLEVNNPWEVTFNHINGHSFELNIDVLKDFTASGDSLLKSFAGKVVYETVLNYDENHIIMELGDVNKGITEVHVNGKKVGIRWYGDHIYDLEPYLTPGENKLKIVYTTQLVNYCIHLKNSATAQRWTKDFSLMPSGIEGPVKLYAKKEY